MKSTPTQLANLTHCKETHRYETESEDDLLIGGYRFELSDLHRANGRYTADEKVSAVMAYMMTGTSKQVQDMTGIPASTVRWWKMDSSWWDDVMSECRRKKQDELDANFTALIHQGVGELKDRIMNGNTVLTKEGTKVRVPMNGKDIAVSMAVIFDKRQLLRGDPTARVERTTEKDLLNNLQAKFEDMARQVNARDITDVAMARLDGEDDNE